MVMIFGPIFLIQTVLAIIVLYVLKRILEYQLVELGITRMENLNLDENEKADEYHVVLTSHRPLNSERKQRLLRAGLKSLGPKTKIQFEIDKRMLGGMVIKVNDYVYSYSLRERLRESGIIKLKE